MFRVCKHNYASRSMNISQGVESERVLSGIQQRSR